MLMKVQFLTTLVICESVLYSSFWAPLFNPRILNYKVDVTFDPDGGRGNRGEYERQFGYRGEKLIDVLGKGRAPKGYPKDKIYNDVKFYYTYGTDADDV